MWGTKTGRMADSEFNTLACRSSGEKREWLIGTQSYMHVVNQQGGKATN
jgi:hypothetical protein